MSLTEEEEGNRSFKSFFEKAKTALDKNKYEVRDSMKLTPNILQISNPTFSPDKWEFVFQTLWSGHCACGFETRIQGYLSDVEFFLDKHGETCGLKKHVVKWEKENDIPRILSDADKKRNRLKAINHLRHALDETLSAIDLLNEAGIETRKLAEARDEIDRIHYDLQDLICFIKPKEKGE